MALAADPGGVSSWRIVGSGFSGSFAYDGAGNIDLRLSAVPPGPQLNATFSRKTHGFSGTFDENLPLTGQPGIECRSGGAAGDFQLVFTFNNNVLRGDVSVAAGEGTLAGNPAFSGNTVSVNLTGVANAQTVTITLSGVTDSFSQVLPDTQVRASFLLGDSNADGFGELR